MAQQDSGGKLKAGIPLQRHEPALACPSHPVRVCMTLLLLGLWATGALAAEPYEQPGEYRAAEVLPQAMVVTPNCQVQDPVVTDGYMYRFTVGSPFGTFEVTGYGALRKLLHEIGAIAALREIKTGKAFGDAVVNAAKGPFRFAKNLITNPVDTVTGIPKGAYKFMEEIATGVTSEHNPSDDPAYMQALQVSGQKRAFAARLGVDVYSSNAVLQKELNSVAWAAAAGNLSVGVALMPVGGGAGAALSGGRLGDTLNEQLKNEPASRLRIINKDKLTAMGIPSDLAGRFLDHRNFSPRHDTILVESLARLQGTRGREQFLEAALTADDEVDATYFTNMAQIMRGYHETVAPLAEMQKVGRLVIAHAKNGKALVALPIDHLLWTSAVDRRSQELKASYKAPGFTGQFDVWVMGTVSPLARQHLTERGISITEEVYKRVEMVD
jgi:hypothetical protein